MWALYVLAVIGASVLVVAVAYAIVKIAGFVGQCRRFDSLLERADDRYWEHEKRFDHFDSQFVFVQNDLNSMSDRITKLERAANSDEGT